MSVLESHWTKVVFQFIQSDASALIHFATPPIGLDVFYNGQICHSGQIHAF